MQSQGSTSQNGVVEATIDCVRTKSRPWIDSGKDQAAEE
jgi:hypothetical protein